MEPAEVGPCVVPATPATSSAHSSCSSSSVRGDIRLLHCDLLSRILLQLQPQDILAVSASCTQLCAAASSEQRIWGPVCKQAWGNSTSVDSWLALGGGAGQQQQGPKLYRELYPILCQHAAYVGVWHGASTNSPKGSLYSFCWAEDGVQVVQLVPTHRHLTQLTRKQLCVLGPAHPRYSAVVLDGDKCVLQDHGSNRHAAPAPCAVAEAAASVAAGGFASRRSSSGSSSSSSGSPSSSSSSSTSGGRSGGGGSSGLDVSAGSSPASSSGFGYELLRFFQSSVQKTRSGRRNRRAGSEPAPVIHHFKRVTGPLTAPASKSHPHQLSGLWKGLYGPHGCEMVAVSYDFSGRAAHIVARKLTGDVNVPAGEVTWKAAAAALPTPWPAQEQQLVALRPQMVAVTAESAAHLAEIEAEDEAAGNVIAALMQQDDDMQQQQQQQHQQQPDWAGFAGGSAQGGMGGGGVGGAAQAVQQPDQTLLQGGIAGYAMQQAQAHVARINAWAGQMQARRVVAIHKGEGQTADRGFKNPAWVEGRLFVYDDGSCGFVYMVRPHVFHLIDMERLDGDL